MRLYNLIKKTQLTTASLLIISGLSYAEPIGDIRETKGYGGITRGEETFNHEVGLEINLNDTAETANGRMLIEFLDKAELQLKEHSRVLIDTIYYDPDPSLSKMTMRMVSGTARFASGSLGLVNKANIEISTPTATIAVRGTDFTTTIDEIGRSLVILLPDEQGKPSGVIEVTNSGGTVILDEAYAATMVASYDRPPTSETVINGITPALIDNMFIVNPPEEVKQRIEEELQDEQDEDQGLLDIDFLDFTELEEDELDEEELDDFTELDIDELDVEFLIDVLDIVDSGDLFDTLGEFDIKGARRGLNEESQYNVFLRDGDLVLFRNVNGLIEIQIGAGGSFTLDTDTPTWQGLITGNDGDDIDIRIKQL
mgnify:CR=1 FL=1|tara:strand:+ start:587 stop:1693 length:1107 start_codon:yes stop_codon:yes gene_type:complete